MKAEKIMEDKKMKFKVFTESKEVEEKEVYFKLVEKGERVNLIACDNLGKRLKSGFILGISADGLELYSCVSEKIGLPLGKYGQVKVTNDK